MRPTATVTVALVALGALLLLGAADAQGEHDSQRAVTVTGSGSVAATPDVALVTLGVETRADSAGAALDRNSVAAEALLDALKGGGVEAADIQTSTLALQPLYDPEPSDAAPAVIGYLATNTVAVRVRALDSLGALLDAAVASGGNTVQGVVFEVSDPGPQLDQARERAVQDARDKAERLATLTGARLGEVLTIFDMNVGVPLPAQSFELKAVPVEAGSLTLTVTVQISWRLE